MPARLPVAWSWQISGPGHFPVPPSLRCLLVSPSSPDSDWERRHPGRAETWAFDFVQDGGRLGGFVALTFLPSAGAAWYWAALVGVGRPYLLVRDLELGLPRRPASREVRGEGLWAGINCETPHEHWSLGLEAFGVALDDPEEALGAERGHRTGLGLDLEWEAADGVRTRAPARPTTGGDYEQFCEVHGEVLVGGGYDVETIAIAAHGWRRHAWGAVDWAATPWSLRGRLAGGGPFASDVATGDLQILQRAPLRLGEGRLERALVAFGDDVRSDAGWGWAQAGRLES